jgi:hypothetical protein
MYPLVGRPAERYVGTAPILDADHTSLEEITPYRFLCLFHDFRENRISESNRAAPFCIRPDEQSYTDSDVGAFNGMILRAGPSFTWRDVPGTGLPLSNSSAISGGAGANAGDVLMVNLGESGRSGVSDNQTIEASHLIQ